MQATAARLQGDDDVTLMSTSRLNVNGAVYQWSQIKQRMAKENASKASLQVQTCHYI